MIRLLAVDLDGTLLNRRGEITPATRLAVAETLARGVGVVLATGRMFRSTRLWAEELGLREMPVICYNGAMVRLVSDSREIFHRPLPLALAREVAAFLDDRGVYFQIYIDDRLYTPDLGERAGRYGQRVRVEPVPVGERLRRPWAPPTKILVMAPPVRILELREELRREFGANLTLSRSFADYLEITAAGVDKGRALRFLAEWWGILPEEVMAAGDGGNDLPMLRFAGLGIAIGGGTLAQSADLAFPSADRDGLAVALRELLLDAPPPRPPVRVCATGSPFSWKDVSCRLRIRPRL